MKQYPDFLLKGSKLFKYWIVFLFSFAIPYAIILYSSFELQMEPNDSGLLLLLFPMLLVIMFAVIIYSFYRLKLTIENIVFEGENLSFSGNIGGFLSIYLLGLLLSVLTFGIYTAWFIQRLQKYIIDKTSYKGDYFSFRGEGTQLFLILLFSLIIPFVVIYLLIFSLILSNLGNTMSIQSSIGYIFVLYLLMFFVLIPYIYYAYKWMINMRFKDYKITLKSKTMPSIGKIAVEFLLSLITLGLYLPMAYLKIYKLFADNTTAESEEIIVKTGFELNALNDFLFFWGQILLTMVTLGLYYPWAYVKITRLIIRKTYLQSE